MPQPSPVHESVSDLPIVVIGAGAAGMVAATQAAQRGRSVILLEKNSKTGVKILMSGGTRCNLTHNTDARGITEAFGHAKRFLQPSVGRFPPSDVVKMFHDADVATKIESTGKIFPESNRAVQVRDALQKMTLDAGAEIRLKTSVIDLKPAHDSSPNRPGWIVTTDQGTIRTAAVIVTAGGKSWPGCGTTGDAYGWLRALGHTIIRPRPALVPLIGGADWMRSLSGITLDDCVATIRERTEQGVVKTGRKSLLTARRSSLLLTHFGLSGPAAMDVSGVMTAAESFDRVQLEIDLLPEVDAGSIEQTLLGRQAGPTGNSKSSGKMLSSLVRLWLPQRLADGLVSHVGGDRPLAELPNPVRRSMVDSLKALVVPITGTRGFEKAEVTAGGVSLSEVDRQTMQSKLHPGLFIAGEVLDVDGWIGGYNFQAAFSTGHAAGREVGDR